MELDMRQEDIFSEWITGEEYKWVGEQLKRDPRVRPSQNKFAGFLGLSPSYYSDIKNGKYLPNLTAIKKMARRLGDEVYIRVGMQPPMPADPRLRFIAQHWEVLDEQEQEQLVEMTERMVEGGPENDGEGKRIPVSV